MNKIGNLEFVHDRDPFEYLVTAAHKFFHGNGAKHTLLHFFHGFQVQSDFRQMVFIHTCGGADNENVIANGKFAFLHADFSHG